MSSQSPARPTNQLLEEISSQLPAHVDLRLVVTDMDGTLLDGEGKVPGGLWSTVERMRRHDIVFTAASGRQLANLRQTLGRAVEGLPLIAENGAVVGLGEQIIHQDALDPAAVSQAVTTVRSLAATGHDVGAVLATAETAYVERGDQAFVNQSSRYYTALTVVDNLLDLPLNEVVKIAVFDFHDVEQGTAQALAQAVPQVQTVVSGRHWADMMRHETSKGRALQALQERLGVTAAQTAVFGDYLNDLQMYAHSELSFAMANAHPTIRQVARYLAPPNTDDGVLRVLGLLLDRA